MIRFIYKFLLPALVLAAILLSGCISQNGPEKGEASASGNSSVNASQSACDASWGKIRAAATIAPLGQFVKAVGGDRVIVTVIVPPAAEPHTFEPTPSQMAELAGSDILVKNGAGLEYWLDRVLQAHESVLVVDSSLGVNLLLEREDEIDPHIWLSLRNAAAIVRNICSGLCEADPENRDFYIKNTEAYLEELKALDGRFNQTFAGKGGRIFIVHHPAWTYFAADYNLTQVAIMEEEKEPGPRHLGEIISLARQNNITTIFAEPQLNPRSAEVIASEMNASVVVLDPLAGDYLQNMRYAGEEIARSLAGQA